MIPTYALNSKIHFTATISVNGVLSDPTLVLFFTEASDGTIKQYNGARSSKGLYYYDFVTSTPAGRWYSWYQGLGSIQIQSLKSPFNIEF